jgi:hypothetical protein
MLQRIALGLLAVTCATAALGAHHGTLINYDRDKQWTSKAVVTEFHYVNPHAQIFFDVTDAKGKVTHYSGELLPNPAQFVRNGWTKKRSVAALQAGTVIKITVAPARAGGTAVLVLRIENEQGEELLGAGPGPGAPEPRPTP